MRGSWGLRAIVVVVVGVLASPGDYALAGPDDSPPPAPPAARHSAWSRPAHRVAQPQIKADAPDYEDSDEAGSGWDGGSSPLDLHPALISAAFPCPTGLQALPPTSKASP